MNVQPPQDTSAQGRSTQGRSRQGIAAPGASGALGEEESPGDGFQVSSIARSERLERRVASLERQLAFRIEHEEELQRQVAHLQRQVAELSSGAPSTQFRQAAAAREAELDANLASARAELETSRTELAALLNTKTMRLARRPRRVYTALRANPEIRKLLERLDR